MDHRAGDPLLRGALLVWTQLGRAAGLAAGRTAAARSAGRNRQDFDGAAPPSAISAWLRNMLLRLAVELRRQLCAAGEWDVAALVPGPQVGRWS